MKNTDYQCKLCYRKLICLSNYLICYDCQIDPNYFVYYIAIYNGKPEIELVGSGKDEPYVVYEYKTQRLRLRLYGKDQYFDVPEFTPEIAQTWHKKLKTYSIFQ